jgi:hypothetical protein
MKVGLFINTQFPEGFKRERLKKKSVDCNVLRSNEDPRPGLKEVLMRVRASSLNYRDLMVLKGGGRGPTKMGVVPLSDGAGEVRSDRRRSYSGQNWRPDSGHCIPVFFDTAIA